MAEVFACLVYVLDGSTVSIDVNVSKIMYKFIFDSEPQIMYMY